MRLPDGYRNHNLDILNQNAKDLIKKKLVPDYAISYFDPAKLQVNYSNWQISGVSNWKCKKCGIVIHGPKDWITQHVKIHFQNKEYRDNETETVELNPY